ncbi:hypothetical protein BDB01DRAFT_833743 [Pilobolus umbonatus]|nr:hypothetical protein BDB01DRAFT_833743 [Pilobolus umbonatus]
MANTIESEFYGIGRDCCTQSKLPMYMFDPIQWRLIETVEIAIEIVSLFVGKSHSIASKSCKVCKKYHMQMYWMNDITYMWIHNEILIRVTRVDRSNFLHRYWLLTVVPIFSLVVLSSRVVIVLTRLSFGCFWGRGLYSMQFQFCAHGVHQRSSIFHMILFNSRVMLMPYSLGLPQQCFARILFSRVDPKDEPGANNIAVILSRAFGYRDESISSLFRFKLRNSRCFNDIVVELLLSLRLRRFVLFGMFTVATMLVLKMGAQCGRSTEHA